jgi:hypothetical protein
MEYFMSETVKVIRFYKTGGPDVLKIEEIQLLGLRAKSEAIDRAKKFIFDGLASELFSAKIARIFVGLDEYAAAHRYMETNDQIGKIAVALASSTEP